jgi:hypothetical protein
MKVGDVPRKASPTKQPPLLSLTLDDGEDEPKGKTVSHNLRVDPADANSNKYKSTVHVLDGTEDVRTIIKHPTEIDRVLTGLNATTVPMKLQLARTLLTGNALTQFNAAVQRQCTKRMEDRILAAPDDPSAQAIHDAGWDHQDNYDVADWNSYCHGMVEKLVPARALAKVKRHLRRHCRKPADMSVRQYYQNLYRINTQEIPNLPPFGDRQSFREDEFIDIILYGTPGSWAREMERQGFDPMDHTAEEVVAFMEQLESAEAHDKTATKVESKKTDKSSPNKKKSSKEDSSKKGTKYCEIHGHCNHTSEECRTSKKRYKSDKSDSKKQYAKGNNKSWKKSSEEETTVAKKDLALLIKKAVKKEMATSKDKKRKASDDEDGFLVECLTKDINGFNYQEMEDLRIDSQDDDTESDDEVSC